MLHSFCFEESVTLGEQFNIIFFFKFLEARVVPGPTLLWDEMPSTYRHTHPPQYNFDHTDTEQCIGSVFVC